MKTYSIEYWLAEFGHETSYSGTDDRVRTEGFQTLAEALAFEECQIEQLILDFNSVGDDGAEALATAMTHYNCKLQQVDFGGELCLWVIRLRMRSAGQIPYAGGEPGGSCVTKAAARADIYR
eukprot:gene5875-7075_t